MRPVGLVTHLAVRSGCTSRCGCQKRLQANKHTGVTGVACSSTHSKEQSCPR